MSLLSTQEIPAADVRAIGVDNDDVGFICRKQKNTKGNNMKTAFLLVSLVLTPAVTRADSADPGADWRMRNEALLFADRKSPRLSKRERELQPLSGRRLALPAWIPSTKLGEFTVRDLLYRGEDALVKLLEGPRATPIVALLAKPDAPHFGIK